jgi:hypothetical protein
MMKKWQPSNILGKIVGKKKQSATAVLRLPVDPDAPPNRTRSQTLIRSDVIKKNNRNRKKDRQQKTKAKFSRKVCNFVGCNTKGAPGIKWNRIPPKPTLREADPKHPLRNIERMQYEVKKTSVWTAWIDAVFVMMIHELSYVYARNI